MKQFIWRNENGSYLFTEADLETTVYLGEGSYLIEGDALALAALNEDALTKAFITWQETHPEDMEDDIQTALELFLEEQGITIESEYCEEFILSTETEKQQEELVQLVYHSVTNQFNRVSDFDTTTMVREHDGRNEKIFYEGDYDITVLTTSDDSVDLDDFDGSNYRSRGLYTHQELFHVETINGKEVEGMILLKGYDDFVGTYTQGRLHDLASLEEYLTKHEYDAVQLVYEVARLTSTQEQPFVLYGIAEFAEEINWSKARIINNLDRQAQGIKVKHKIPTPIAVLKSGSVWSKQQVEVFKEMV